ncbi:septum formation inhibitor Maf [Rhodothermus sp. AH-315-K08]|nr:septum formation inhibitor Maf [Rhodothermus sp. AH-315-K08]
MSAALSFRVPFVLASKSPRRKKLLEALGLRLVIQPSDAPEIIEPGLSPAEVVQQLAKIKAADIAQGAPESLVLGADTIVVLNHQILGKPRDPAEAREMLSQLSGQTHTVYTGIALIHLASNRSETRFAATEVSFGILTDEEVNRYVKGGSPMDKAGAYGIQDDAGALFIDGISGDYNNVVGLPLRTLYLMLLDSFSDLLQS